MHCLRSALATLVLSLACVAPADAATVFKWTDDAGNVQYTDSPPEGRPFQKLNVAGSVSRAETPPEPVQAPPLEAAAADDADDAVAVDELDDGSADDVADGADEDLLDDAEEDLLADAEEDLLADSEDEAVAEAPAPAPAPAPVAAPPAAPAPNSVAATNCDNSRKNVTLLESETPVLMDLNGDGEQETLDPTQRATELRRSREMVNVFCTQ